jgi:hypothetical protein
VHAAIAMREAAGVKFVLAHDNGGTLSCQPTAIPGSEEIL